MLPTESGLADKTKYQSWVADVVSAPLGLNPLTPGEETKLTVIPLPPTVAEPVCGFVAIPTHVTSPEPLSFCTMSG